VADNVYFVGNSRIAVWLITGSEGHILLDTGYEDMVPEVVASIEALGFSPTDIRFIASSHAHFDHVGGHAAMKELTGAEVMAVPGDLETLEAGGITDPVLGERNRFPPVEVDRELMDAEAVVVGDFEMISYVTAGHTAGCTSWTMRAVVDGVERTVVFVCSLSILDGTRLIDPNASYRGIAQDYRRSVQLLRNSGCEVFLGPHGSFFNLDEKLAAVQAGAASSPFVDPDGCMAYVDRAEERFNTALAEEQGTSPAPAGQ
jgi:metallo-beta-lactamase class B